ncbi:MAG: glycosyltransferase [Alphaproteobacteria bacterium]|nr:glycosyltransferase [Alphaproteobacteria bacterium]
MTIWMDLTNSLTQHKGNVVGIVRAELMRAKNLHEIDPSIRFSVLTDYGFREVKKSELRWLFKSQNINDDYRKYQKRKSQTCNRIYDKICKKLAWEIFRFKRHYLKPRNISRNRYLTYPYSDGDVVYSCGWFGTRKEEFYSRIRSRLQDFKLVYTIYDLVMIKDNLRHLYFPADSLFDEYLYWISTNCCAAVYCGHTAQIDSEKYFKEKDLNIPEGHWLKYGGDTKNQLFKRDADEVLESLGVKKPYILAIGSFDHKKNYKILYQAYCQLKQRGAKNIPQLVIVGRKLANNELQDNMLNNLLTKDYVKIMGCSDEELNALYNNCTFAVLPSLYEGYSVVLLETLQYGKLCLTSDTPPLREVGNDCAYFINPEHAKDWADAIEKFMNNPDKIAEWEQKVTTNFKPISWKESTQSLYDSLVSVRDKEFNEEQVTNNVPTLYYDISLLWYSAGLSGIPRTQMLLARHLHKYNQNIKYFWMNQGVYCELSHKQLSCLLGKESLDKAVVKTRESIRGYTTKNVLPFKKGDVVLSAGVGYDNASYDNLIKHHKNTGFTYCNVIYDLTPITVPHTHPEERVKAYPEFLEKMYALSDYIFYGGQTAQKDGEKYQTNNNLTTGKSFALKWGSDIVSHKYTQKQKESVFKKYGITGDFILSVGTIEARKNQEVLYEAYLELQRSAKKYEKLPQIVICGHPGWKTEHFRHVIDVDNRIRNKVMLITPTDDELDILYQNCIFTCLPSFYEGWSLTLPESLNYGKFCLASDTPSLLEIGGDIIDYANPYDPVEWAEKIMFYYTNTRALKQREAAIKKKWHNTTWEECAKNINDVLHKLMEN